MKDVRDCVTRSIRPSIARLRRCPGQECRVQRRFVQLSSIPSTQDAAIRIDAPSATQPTEGPDAQFEIIGSTSSLLSASVSASQPLYTRRGTLAGFSGNPEHATSRLSLLEPVRRAAGGIPFLYQKIISTSPLSLLIAAKSPMASYSIIQLDGRLDWMITQRNALLAWTGHTLSLRPELSTSLGLAHWGRTSITGRGLVCLTGKGPMHKVSLKTGEEYIIHPSHVVAYAIMRHSPQPYRFKSSALRLQIPGLGALPDTRFFNTMRQSGVIRFMASAAYKIRTWFRRSVLGDRLFLRFQGPADILLQSRGGRLGDSLTHQQIDETADSPAGAVNLALQRGAKSTISTDSSIDAATPVPAKVTKPQMFHANVKQNGHVEFEK